MAKEPTYKELEQRVNELVQAESERKRIDEALRESEEKFRLISEQSLMAIVILQDNGIKYANQAYAAITGNSMKEIMNWTIADTAKLIYADDRDFVMEQGKKKAEGIKEDTVTRYSYRGVRKTGEVRWIDQYSKTITYRGKPADLMTFIDIHDQKLAQETLQKSEEKYRELADSLPQVVFETDEKGKLTFINRNAFDLFGYSQQDFDKGVTAIEMLIPEDRNMAMENIQRVMRGEDTGGNEYTARRKDGSTFPISIHSNALIRENKLMGMRGIIVDLTLSKQAAEALRESEERYRTLVDNLPVAVYRNTPGPKGKFLMANPAFCNMFGFKNEEEVKKVAPADLYVNPKERKEYSDNLVQKGVLKDFERTLLKKDGTPVHTSITSRVVYGKDREVSHFDSIMLDISEQKLAEEALREGEEKYRTILESIEDGYFEVDIAGNFTFFNDSLCEMLGYSKDELMGMNNRQYTDKENAKELYQTFNRVYTTGKPDKGFDWKIIRKDGTERSVEASVSLRTVAKGKPIGFRGVVRDISEKQRFEAQLQHAQKMEAIATLAGGVAHEFNNALMGIMGNIELLKMDLSENERVDKSFDAMKSSGHRMFRLTDQLLAYAQGGKYQPKNLKLDDFVIQTVPILQHDLSPEVRVETHFPKDISYIKADNAQMQMVLSAILANSNEAIEDEGIIRIAAEDKDIDEGFTKQHPGLKPGAYVCLTIEDDGKGMDEETKDGIFEPFFTTKFQGRGMGMAAVYGIVKNHDGWIYVDSELGKGTTVQIYLPAVSAGSKEQGAKAGEQPEVELATGEGTILMIEDEDVVIEVTQAMLEWLGYRVMVAKTGKDAIHIAETFDGQIDLALLDIKLPDMEGGKVYPHIMEARPDLKVIVFSGYAIEGPARKILDAGAQDFIQKPFSLTTLSEKLKEVLGGNSP